MPKRREVHPEQLEELFADLWQLSGFTARRGGYRPHVDCYRSDEPPAVTVVVDLPGIDPEDVEITVSERTVTIAGERRRPRRESRVSYRQMEIEYGPFHRRISLAEDVDPDRAEALYERGRLTIVMPLARKPRAGRILIVLGDGSRPR
ncbi:MAG TPA: Hsp20/alpha crystallin family protein [Gaiellaceae bacterium]|nr:Hsp20/alpha crystallin family protein [Gaiellaceae bacterium]